MASVLFFESVLPYLRPRVVEVANVPPAGHIARFDNDVHFQAIRIGTYGFWNNVVETDFSLFLATDHSSISPSMETVSRILVRRRGYRFKPLGDILGGRALRADLRRVQLAMAANTAAMVKWRQKPHAQLDPDDPPLWITARFTFLPKGRDGYSGYDWEVLGHRVLNSIDELRSLLVAGSAR